MLLGQWLLKALTAVGRFFITLSSFQLIDFFFLTNKNPIIKSKQRECVMKRKKN